jgi:hypothetical protein
VGGQVEVRPREPSEHLDTAAFEPELSLDLGAHIGRRRRGACQDARRGKLREERADAQVVGSKVVPPVGDAVRLIDGHERDRASRQKIDERAGSEPLGCRVDELVLAASKTRLTEPALRRFQRRGEKGRGDAARSQGTHLILHQRDEGGQNQRRSGQDGGRELIRQGLSASRRCDDQDASRRAEKGRDGLLLPRAKGGQAETLSQHHVEVLRVCGRHRGSRRDHTSPSALGLPRFAKRAGTVREW